MITRLFILIAALLVFIAGPAPAQAQNPIISFIAPSGKTVFRQGTTYFVDACGKPSRARDMRCYAKVVTNVRGEPLASSGTINGFKAADLRSAYGQPAILPAAGANVVAVVIPYDYAKLESNLATYRTAMGLPACTTANGCFSRIYQGGVKPPAPPAGSNWGVEVSLDTQMVSAMCPECKIRVYEATAADSANLATMVALAAGDPAVLAISNSYGNTEATWFADANIANDAVRYQSSNGAIVFASGDTGYGVNCPACLNTVLAVGGTTLKKTTTGRLWSETAWAKAGSGCDRDSGALYARPSWNTTQMPPAAPCTRRMVADVAAVADPATGVAVYGPCGFSGILFGTTSWCVVGGTSASAPIWAGLIGSRGKPADASYPAECAGVTTQNRIGCFLTFKAASKTGAAPPYTYGYNAANAQLNDATTGSNGSCSGTILCTAAPGYDGPTGLGTPKAGALTNTANP